VHSRTFPRLLAGVGKRRAVWAEYLFIYPIANITVLGCPDLSTLGTIAERYTAFVNARTAIPIAEFSATDPLAISGAGNTSASDAAQP
jgi:hypothetical protein